MHHASDIIRNSRGGRTRRVRMAVQGIDILRRGLCIDELKIPPETFFETSAIW
jgi:hypothetical protein